MLLALIYLSASVALFGMYLLIIFIPRLPQFIKDTFYYGKLKNESQTFVKFAEIPKQSFTYFYLLGGTINSIAATSCLYCYTSRIAFPSIISSLLKHSLGSDSHTQTNAFTPVFILFMVAIQCWRRYKECVNTSIFSHSTINLFHFMTGVFVYSTFPLSLLTQAIPPESNKSSLVMQISYQHILGFVLFCTASFTQSSTHITLAELRLDNKSKVKDLNHHVPKGWMFKHVSCPHYLSEIFIYCSFCLADSFQSEILTYILLFVIVNQMIAAHMNHTWYKRTFKDYPKDRKAIIPFIF